MTTSTYTLSNKFNYQTLVDFVSITKPRLSSLVIFTAGIGIYLSGHNVSFIKALQVLIPIATLVAGACAANCWKERHIDKRMKRTAVRPLPSGRMSPNVAITYSLFLCASSLTLIYFWANPLTALLGFVATFFYIWLYTPAKQKTPNAVFLGAVPGAMPPLMGQVALSGEIEAIGIVLFGILFLWQLPHFLAISIMYSKDYQNAGIKVFPNTVGVKKTILNMINYSILLVGVCYLPVYLGLIESFLYRGITLGVGFLFCFYAVQGLSYKNNEAVIKWAKKFFWGTLAYLPIQLGSLLILL